MMTYIVIRNLKERMIFALRLKKKKSGELGNYVPWVWKYRKLSLNWDIREEVFSREIHVSNQ